MTGAGARMKGYAFEREIAHDFHDIGYKGAKRHLEYQNEEAMGVDLDDTGNFRVQCKRHKKYVSISKLDEIKLDGIKLLLTKADRQPTVAVLYWSDLKDILSKLNSLDGLD